MIFKLIEIPIHLNSVKRKYQIINNMITSEFDNGDLDIPDLEDSYLEESAPELINLDIYNDGTHEENLKDTDTVTIQTHDGCFYLSDVGAVSLLTSYYNQSGTKVHLIRSSDPELLNNSDILVDVGGIYNPESHRYDHTVFPDIEKMSMSSIGMVWEYFGIDLLKLYIESQREFNGIQDWESLIHGLHKEVYDVIIRELDSDATITSPSQIMGLSSIISSMNPSNSDDEVEQMNSFEEAVRLFGRIFEIKLREVISEYFNYQLNLDIIKKHLDEVPENIEYLIITEKVEHILRCLNVLDPKNQIKFLIFQIPDETITIRTRHSKKLEKDFIPLLTEEKAKDGLGDDLIFVHENLSIAKTKTVEGAVSLVGHSILANANVSEYVPTSYLNLSRPRKVGKWLIAGGVGLAGLVVVGTLWFKTQKSDLTQN